MLMNESKRIAYVLKRYPRYSETFIVNEILAHEEAGVEIEIFSLLPPQDSHFQDIISRVRAPVNYLPNAHSSATHFWTTLKQASQVFPDMWVNLKAAASEDMRNVYQALVLIEQARLKGINHFHAHFGSAATSVVRIASHISGIPYTFTAHAKDIFHQNVQFDDLRQKLQDAAAVITVSDYNLDYLVSKFGLAGIHVQRIYNGLHLQDFPYAAGQERPPTIIYVGRLVEKKGVSYLIDACSNLVSRGVQFECNIVGAGELEIDLRTQIDRMGLNDRVQLVGPRPQKEILQLVQRATVLAAPCVIANDGNRDGLPTVIIEAMALGTVCVATDVTGIPEVIRDRQTGLLVSQQNSSKLADALELLLTDSSLRIELATNARRLVEEKFDISRNTVRMRKIFDSVRAKEQQICELEAA